MLIFEPRAFKHGMIVDLNESMLRLARSLGLEYAIYGDIRLYLPKDDMDTFMEIYHGNRD